MNRNLQLLLLCIVVILGLGTSITMIIKGEEKVNEWETDKRPFVISKYLGIIGDQTSVTGFYYIYGFENGCSYSSTTPITINTTIYMCVDTCPVDCNNSSHYDNLLTGGVILLIFMVFFSGICFIRMNFIE